ncbi:MAG: hypothetical protein ACE5D8_00630 [Fidelibacterota bacterium]
MIRKITSILTLFLLVMTTTAPMLGAQESCDLCCCEENMDTCMLGEATACSMEMSECDTPVLLPLVVVPLTKTEQKVSQEMNMVPADNVVVVPIEPYISYVLEYLILPHAPPAFNRPLLI